MWELTGVATGCNEYFEVSQLETEFGQLVFFTYGSTIAFGAYEDGTYYDGQSVSSSIYPTPGTIYYNEKWCGYSNFSSGKLSDIEPRTIKITGGNDIENAIVVEWFNNYATRID